jgi:hypothetical protein
MVLGTYLSTVQRLEIPTYPVRIAGHSATLYIGCIALMLNLLLTVALSVVFDAVGLRRHADGTVDSDYLLLEKPPMKKNR